MSGSGSGKGAPAPARSSPRRIATKLIAGIVVFSTIVAAIISALQIWSEYDRDVSGVRRNFDLVRDSYVDSVTEYVWLADRARLRTLLVGIEKLPDVVYAGVQMTNGPTIEVGVVPQGAKTESRTLPLRRQFRGSELEIGVLTVVVSLEGSWDRALERAIFVVLANGLKTLLVVAFAWFVIHRIVTHRLESIADHARDIAVTGYAGKRLPETDFAGRAENDEITALGLHYNAALDALDAELERTRLLSSIVEHSPHSIMVTDAEGRIEYVNRAFVESSGYLAGEVLGQSPRLFQSGATAPETYRDLWQTILRGDVWHGELLNVTKSGKRIWEREAVWSLRDAGGAISKFVAIREDVSRLKAYQDELIAAKERAEAGDLAKSTFLAMMSHELRTPLNAVIGFSEIIRRESLGPVGTRLYAEYASDIERSGHRLLEIVNDVLEMAGLETGKLNPDLGPTDLAKEVDALRPRLAAVVAEGGHALTIEAENGRTAICDKGATRKILLNLVSNAAKYTRPGGRIEIRIRYTCDARVQLVVKDDGVGMSKDDIERATEPFLRLQNRKDAIPQGVGIGLYMVKRLAEMTGATLDIESAVQTGTTVTVSFPAASAARASAQP
jgi:PAS domain S-box-containing protein